MHEGHGSDAAPGAVTTTLRLTQTLARGSADDFPAVFADPACAALGLSRTWFLGLFSGALPPYRRAAPTAGRLIDTYGDRDALADAAPGGVPSTMVSLSPVFSSRIWPSGAEGSPARRR